jgi:hypothetical protein
MARMASLANLPMLADRESLAIKARLAGLTVSEQQRALGAGMARTSKGLKTTSLLHRLTRGW